MAQVSYNRSDFDNDVWVNVAEIKHKTFTQPLLHTCFYIILWGLNNCRKPSQKFICEPRKWFSFFLFSTIFFSFFRETTNTITPAFSMGVRFYFFEPWQHAQIPPFFCFGPSPTLYTIFWQYDNECTLHTTKAKEISLFWTSQNIKKRSHSDYKIQQKAPFQNFQIFQKMRKKIFKNT